MTCPRERFSTPNSVSLTNLAAIPANPQVTRVSASGALYAATDNKYHLHKIFPILTKLSYNGNNSAMKILAAKSLTLVAVIGVTAILIGPPALANGPIGDHVNNLKGNLDRYGEEVEWMIGKVDGIVDAYEQKGTKAANTQAVVEHWEAVDFHAAIETTYVPVYAKIWQGLYGVKQGIDNKKPIAEVRQEQAKLEQALWQAFGAVKLAAQYQERGLLDKIKTTEGSPTTPVETLDEVKTRLDRVVAKYAEKLNDEAITIVHNTYLNLFEGVEGELIAQDAKLVEDLEKDFNVTLPKAIEGGASVDEVRKVVDAMHTKLDRAKSLLNKAEKDKKDVF